MINKRWYVFFIVVLTLIIFLIDYHRDQLPSYVLLIAYVLFFFVGSFMFAKIFEKKKG